MGDLVLDSLEIRNFRCFRDLRIERLGRVNLIVGKNGVGKTALLEALVLYAETGDPEQVQELLRARNEDRTFAPRTRMDRREQSLPVKNLFYGRREITEQPVPIRIGQIDTPNKTLSLSIGWVKAQDDEERDRIPELLDPAELSTANNPLPRLIAQIGHGVQYIEPLGVRISYHRFFVSPDFDYFPYELVPAIGLDDAEISRLWDDTALTDREEDVVKALRIITPQVERLNIVGEATPGEERLPIVRILGLDIPVPLRSLGEGMNRLLGLALALVNVKDGMLLVDEIESGLHYSVQPDMWRLIFETARRLNVQVFATTHSWDCIEAFQHAATADTQAEGMLIRLEERRGDIVAVVANEHDLEIITRDQIEVR